MRNIKQTKEEMEKRHAILSGMGFSCVHNEIYEINANPNESKYIEIDFSAIDSQKFLSHAFKKIYENGLHEGEKVFKRKIASFVKECMELETDE